MVKKNMSNTRIVLASVLGSVISLQLGAFSVVLETLVSGIAALSFGQFVTMMQPIHLAIGTVEGFITAAVIIFVKNTRPELLNIETSRNSLEFKQVLAILSAIVVLIGGGLSLVASSKPDGLEWSIQKVTGSTEVEAYSKNVAAIDRAAVIQHKTAILPDYAFSDSESAIGTTFSGVFGSVVVAMISVGCCILFKLFKKNDQSQKTSATEKLKS
jgi:cobalt/nickel transport system permease protein